MPARHRSSPVVLLIRWGVPALLVLGGVVLLIMSGGHLSGVQDNAQESNVFVSTSLDRDSVLSAAGVGLIVMAAIVVLLGWLLRLNASERGDRDKEDAAREHLRRTGHWPDEE
ncbi:MAG: hypothetical protein FWD04_02400 [Conexibacteraceae bacterium]|nr:hypothetical protein [Conexibacteraceae bacterium]